MPLIPLEFRRVTSSLRRHSVAAECSVADDGSALFPEQYFHEMLDMERMRAQRSGKALILMQLGVAKLLGDVTGKTTLDRIIAGLRQNTRAIDIKGWYRQDQTIGIVFVDVYPIDIKHTIEKIHNKIFKFLSTLLDLNQLNNIDIDISLFPEETNTRRKAELHGAELFTPSESEVLPGPGENGTAAAAAASEPFSYRAEIALGFPRERLLLMLGDLFFIAAAVVSGTMIRFGKSDVGGLVTTYLPAYLMAMGVCVCLLYVFDMYNVVRDFHSRESLLRLFLANSIAGLVIASLFYMFPNWQLGRGILLLMMLLLFASLAAWRLLYSNVFQKGISKRGALVLGAGDCGVAISNLLASPLSPYTVKGFLTEEKSSQNGHPAPVLGTLDQLSEVIQRVWVKTLIMATSRQQLSPLVRTILQSRFQGLEIKEMATVYERLTGRVPVQYIEDQWLLFADGFYLVHKEYIQKLKRLLDILAASLLLLIFAPLMALIYVAIRIDSPGSGFYRQERVGKGGKIFKVWKFRSMRQDAEARGAPQWAQKNDPRVTRIGHWIRLFRLDELPQIWNVFTGDMSLVGPRPERPQFVDELEAALPYYAIRHSVQPGITGWAQVNYNYGASVEDALQKLEYDLFYVKNMSLLLDFKILLKTIGVVILGEGAR